MDGKLLAIGGALLAAGVGAFYFARRQRAPEYAGRACSLRTRLGQRLKHIPESGPYDVCLTANQRKTLFGSKQPGAPIGCGTFACVWQGKRPGQVVKITRDREDVEGLRAAQGMDRVVKIYDSRLLPGAGRDVRSGKQIPVYAIVADRLRPLSTSEQKALDKPLERARVAMIRLGRKYRGAPAAFRVGEPERAELARGVCARMPGKGCEKFARSFVSAWSELFRRGIVWQDAHTGNVAIDGRGRWRAIDLGYSGLKRRTKIPALNGLWE